MANSLFDGQVPGIWTAKSFNSLKPLSAWTQELKNRLDFVNKWIDFGTPNHYWLPGFFFPQAFFTGIMQNFARKTTTPIDKISFNPIIVDDMQVRFTFRSPTTSKNPKTGA